MLNQQSSAKALSKMANFKSGGSSDQKLGARECFLALAIITIIHIQLLPLVVCQDFEDLNNKQTVNGNFLQLSQHTFQPLNRQPQQQQQQLAASSNAALPVVATNSRQPAPARPILSSRFAPQPSAGQLNTQASSSVSAFASPQSAQQPGPQTSNIEQIMKNALARSARLEAAEPRQDSAPAPLEPPAQQSRSSVPQQQTSAASSDKVTDSSETNADIQPGSADDGDKATTATQTITTNGHETVYSDQRFANLFARRNTAKKVRINPTEQVKAKPTLPSFIKSPPDPKQFTATASNGQDRPATPSSTNFASARLQQQQTQSRINLANQQKKAAAITSSSAANANNKRTNSLNGKPTNQAVTPKPAASNLKSTVLSTTSKPVATNNPFNRSQGNNSDPANVIAMARKRLLANNALESGKLKQQQHQQQQQKPSN